MAWFYLIIGGIFEVGWALGLKYSDGFTNLTVLIPTAVLLAVSFWLFSKSLQLLPISTGYAIYTGLGAFGSVILGMFFFGESKSARKLLLVFGAVASIVGLKLVS